MSDSPTVVDVIRVSQSDQGTFGALVLNGRPFCVTLELPWLDNKRDISCIPEGSYLCQRVESNRFGEAFTVREVPGRTHILLHKGNTVEDTTGCILLGQRFLSTGSFGRSMILDSRLAFSAFMDALNGQETFKLVISKGGDSDGMGT